MSTTLPTQADDFPAWYGEVVRRAELAEHSSVRGSMVIKPYGFAIWELLQRQLDDRIKATGHENVYFPLLVPMSVLAREADLVEGFAPQVAVVTEAAGSKLEDPLVVRPTSEAAVKTLRALGLHPILLTGDSPITARAVAGSVGIEDVRAGVTPAGKLATIEELRRQGRMVAMVGDGVNDAAALAAADLGIAMGTGTDVAIQASDLTLVRADLGGVVDALRLSRATLRTIKGNLFWAFAYNVAAIPLAAAGLVDPVVAAAAMALSSLFVVGNSLRLFRYRSA